VHGPILVFILPVEVVLAPQLLSQLTPAGGALVSLNGGATAFLMIHFLLVKASRLPLLRVG
jgi:hypothetical protein